MPVNSSIKYPVSGGRSCVERTGDRQTLERQPSHHGESIAEPVTRPRRSVAKELDGQSASVDREDGALAPASKLSTKAVAGSMGGGHGIRSAHETPPGLSTRTATVLSSRWQGTGQARRLPAKASPAGDRVEAADLVRQPIGERVQPIGGEVVRNPVGGQNHRPPAARRLGRDPPVVRSDSGFPARAFRPRRRAGFALRRSPRPRRVSRTMASPSPRPANRRWPSGSRRAKRQGTRALGRRTGRQTRNARESPPGERGGWELVDQPRKTLPARRRAARGNTRHAARAPAPEAGREPIPSHTPIRCPKAPAAWIQAS